MQSNGTLASPASLPMPSALRRARFTSSCSLRHGMSRRTTTGAPSTSPAILTDRRATSPTTASRHTSHHFNTNVMCGAGGCEHAVDGPGRTFRCHWPLRRRAHPALVHGRRPAAAGHHTTPPRHIPLMCCSPTSQPWPLTRTLWSSRLAAGRGRRARHGGVWCERTHACRCGPRRRRWTGWCSRTSSAS